MVQVSGPLHIVTPDPVQVSGVWVRAVETRPHGDGIMLDGNGTATIEGGVVSFTAAPGPASMTITTMDGDDRIVDLLIPDEETATLKECFEPRFEWKPEVVSRVATLVSRAESAASSAEAGRVAVEQAATSASAASAAAESASGSASAAAESASGSASAAVGAAGTATSARDAALSARGEAEGYAAQARTSAQSAADDASSAQLAESGAGTARDQAQTLVSQANQALDQALAVIVDAESLQDVVTALEMVDTKISAAIADLVGTAPEHLDTLGELAASVEGLDPALRDLIAERLALADVAVDVIADKVVRRNSTGDVLVPATPSGDTSAVAKAWVQAQLTQGLSGKANAAHSHGVGDVPATRVIGRPIYADKLVRTRDDGKVFSLATPTDGRELVPKSYVDSRPAFFSGTGAPPSSIPGAVAGDYYLNQTDMSLHKITGV